MIFHVRSRCADKVDARAKAEGTYRLCALVNPYLTMATKMEANNPLFFFYFIKRKAQSHPVGASASGFALKVGCALVRLTSIDLNV
jgi:hypothetical protein